jgi:hypothetical protein
MVGHRYLKNGILLQHVILALDCLLALSALFAVLRLRQLLQAL